MDESFEQLGRIVQAAGCVTAGNEVMYIESLSKQFHELRAAFARQRASPVSSATPVVHTVPGPGTPTAWDAQIPSEDRDMDLRQRDGT
eukprot:3129997-Pyramimonas_sp.AAC.1